jgi:hypothetical protein
MNEMVERVAKAISGSGVTSPASLRKARAAIAAMREPTDEMLSAFSSWAMPIGYTKEGWSAAIDEALR